LSGTVDNASYLNSFGLYHVEYKIFVKYRNINKNHIDKPILKDVFSYNCYSWLYGFCFF
jgi:hypothetical protein